MVTGPQKIHVTQPYHHQPMWHRAGGMIVVCDEPGLRVTEQDWSSLTLEVFPAAEGHVPVETRRTVFEKSQATSPHEVGQTPLRLRTGGGDGIVRLEIGAATARAQPRAWVVRIQLLRGQSVVGGSAVVTTTDGDGVVVSEAQLRTIEPATSAVGFFPFQGSGSAPAAGAGSAVEVSLPLSGHGRVLELRVQ